MTTNYEPLANSSFLDFTGYRTTDATTVAAAYGFTDGAPWDPATQNGPGINVALVLARNDDPTALLAQDWGTRQRALQQLVETDTLWRTYGANAAQYQTVLEGLASLGFTADDLLTAANSNYVARQDSRTIWVSITAPAQFQALFGQTLMYSPSKDLFYWDASGSGAFNGLALPSGWNVTGLWFDMDAAPDASTLSAAPEITLEPGAQGVGNQTLSPGTANYTPIELTPDEIASLYDFPLDGLEVPTGAIGLIEPSTGSKLPGDPAGTTFQAKLEAYLRGLQRLGTGQVHVQGIDGQTTDTFGTRERTLDVAVASVVNPNSDISLYNGSGSTAATGLAQGSTFTAAQSAIWDPTAGRPAVTSNSFLDPQSSAPESPFYAAYWQLSIDAALMNQTTFIALGDGGSGNETGNGLANVLYNQTPPWNILVGGTSISTAAGAHNDPTLSDLFAPAMTGNAPAVWQLVSAGLTKLPADAAAADYFTEAVWNDYYVSGNEISAAPGSPFQFGYHLNSAGSGGVDVTQAAPSYQTDDGLTPTTSDGTAPATGRGVPDVSAAAAGNVTYSVVGADMLGTMQTGGTSASAPLWASLAVQLNAIFNDQGLPDLGYMNDLLYTASAIAPASFNDVQLGNNTSSFVAGTGDYESPDPADRSESIPVKPTGYGYEVGPGYDLATGLGSPNGTVLARTMTAIAHAQMYFATVPDVLASNGSSATSQTLLIQTLSPAAAMVGFTGGAQSQSFLSAPSASFAWTAGLAGRSEQSAFGPELVKLFDGQSQGSVGQANLNMGDAVSVTLNGAPTAAVTATLTNAFGFVDFQQGNGPDAPIVRLARAEAVAETALKQDDQTAVVRLRQNSQDDYSLMLYRTDDLSGTIGTLHPGDAGYAAAAQGSAYQTSAGGSLIGGPGYRNYGQAVLERTSMPAPSSPWR
jgi:hypothetical protein